MPRVYAAGQTPPVVVPVATAQAVAIYDLVALVSNTLVRAEDIAWDTNLATTQTAFATAFLGVSNVAKLANVAQVTGHPTANQAVVAVTGRYEFPAAAGTYNVGTLVGPAKATGDALLSQTVAVVDAEAKAFGRVVQPAGVNPATVVVEILSKVVPAARQS